MNYIKDYIKDWNLFEKIFLKIGLILSVSTTIIFEGSIINTLYTASYFITALLLAKGKVECYFIGFISVFFYGIVSYRQAYYGELLITIFLTFPIMFVGVIEWIRNRNKEDNTVIINMLPKKR